jgi:hypothetical protein
MPETVHRDLSHYVIDKGIPDDIVFTTADDIFDLGWFGRNNEHGKNQQPLLGEEFRSCY